MSFDKQSNDEMSIRMFGMSIEEIDNQVTEFCKMPFRNEKDLCVSMLSDVQELLNMGYKEEARKKINIVKYILTKDD